jgi:hypothetical protein
MRPLVATFAVAVLAGCGASHSSSAPTEDPGKTMVQLVRHELAGELESSYAMLVRGQREAVDRALYLRCLPGPPRRDVRVLVLGVTDEVYDVPTLGKVPTKAVHYEMSIPDAAGKRMRIASTGHLIAQEGTWRWTLSSRSFSAMLAGACP